MNAVIPRPTGVGHTGSVIGKLHGAHFHVAVSDVGGNGAWCMELTLEGLVRLVNGDATVVELAVEDIALEVQVLVVVDLVSDVRHD